MLSLSHISFSYGLVQILDDVSIEVPKAKVVCVMGRNGVGKTTLMRNIVGLEKASKGSVTLDGRDISKVPAGADDFSPTVSEGKPGSRPFRPY